MPASRVAQVLADTRVPVVVLNACQSAAVGKELEAAVATRLLGGGVASVVAMAYSVYTVAAAEFMAAFYERLFAGGTVSAAVTAGRQQMFRKPGRPSPKGDLPLADWLVPVHYLRREVSFPQAVTARPAALSSLERALEEVSAAEPSPGTDDLDAVGGLFVGRDALFYDLEAAARLQKVVVLAGPGGTGKTELARAFARWWRDTGGVEHPQWVFWHSFEPGVASFGLDGVISKIGLGLYGEQFALLEPGQRRAVVMKALTEHRMLLVWDNFESVRSMPDPARATPPLDEDGCAELREFLAMVAAANSGSAVLVTSRTTEDWLGDVRRIRVGGLAPHEAAEYAGILLAPYPAVRKRRESRAFGDLMQWLDGHPLSMRMILPRLDGTGPAELLAALQGTVPPAVEETTGADRTGSLAASIAYSYAHLAPDIRRLLPAVCMFHGLADVDVLAIFSDESRVPDRFAGTGREDWETVLEAAAGVGLLARVGAGMYRMHPALPRYLAVAWQTQDSGYPAARAAADSALLVAHAVHCEWLNKQIGAGDAGLAYAVLGLEQRTLGSILGYAIDHGCWAEAQAILQPLERYWDTRGLDTEVDTWADRIQAATEATVGAPPPLDTPAGTLWLHIVGNQADRELKRHHLGRAEDTYRQIMNALQAMDTSSQQQYFLATSYHQLGGVAQFRGNLDEAEDWYRQSLIVKEELGDRPGMERSFNELGIVAQFRGNLDEAEDWYRQSLAISEDLGDRPSMARGYHQLGLLAEGRGNLDEAEDWYRQSLAISEDLGDRPSMEHSYHQLGVVAQFRGNLDEAEDWYRRSLAISEELGDRPGMTVIYHQLGSVAQDRRELNTAEDWYRRSLAISEELGDRPGMPLTCHHLGVVAQLQGNLDEAEDWYRQSLAISEDLDDRPNMALTYTAFSRLVAQRGKPMDALAWAIRCVALFDQIPHPSTGTGLRDLTDLTSKLGMTTLEYAWQEIVGNELPQAVREHVARQVRREGDPSSDR